MKRPAFSSALLAFIVGCILAAVAWGDLLPFPGGKGSRPIPPGQRVQDLDLNKTPVSMRQARVDVVLKRRSADLVATVEAEFKMVCSEAGKPSTTFETAMPVVEGGSVASYRLIYLKIDGKPVPADQIRKTTWTASSGQKVYQGFVWPTTMRRGAEQSVSIAYELRRRPNPQGRWHFTYILSSGAEWFGPIGHETVHIRPEKGLQMQPASSSLRPRREADGSILWEIDNDKPQGDVIVEIMPVS